MAWLGQGVETINCKYYLQGIFLQAKLTPSKGSLTKTTVSATNIYCSCQEDVHLLLKARCLTISMNKKRK